MSPFPTRKQEAWRYAHMEALAKLWPLPEAEKIHLDASAVFKRVIIQQTGGVIQLALSLAENAQAHIHILNIGGDYGRIDIAATLQQGADLKLSGVQIGNGTQTLEIVTTIKHAAPHATSTQLVRTIVGDQATGSYLGRIEVAPEAQKTDAAQSSKAMLLARTATANTKPELIIHADDVKCAHGATVGELDKQALFYMAARGIDPAEARTLLMEAFVAEAIDMIADETDRAAFARLATARLRQVTGHA